MKFVISSSARAVDGRSDRFRKALYAIVRGSVELQEAVRSPKVVDACLDFYISKIK